MRNLLKVAGIFYAVLLLTAGDLYAAVDEYQAAIDKGMTCEKSGMHDEAVSEFKRAIEMKPTSADAYRYLGQIYITDQKWDDAIECYTKVVIIDEKDAESFNNRGLAYLARVSSGKASKTDLHKTINDFNMANADFTEAIKINPEFAAAYYNRGLTLLAKYDKAITDFTMAIRLKPDHARAYYYRAVEYFNLKEYDKSWEDVRKAQGLGYKVDPNFVRKLSEKSAAKK